MNHPDCIRFKGNTSLNLTTKKPALNSIYDSFELGVELNQGNINAGIAFLRKAIPNTYNNPEIGLSSILESDNPSKCYWLFIGKYKSLVNILTRSLGSYCSLYPFDVWQSKKPEDDEIYKKKVIFVENVTKIDIDHISSFIDKTIFRDNGSILRCNVKIILCNDVCPIISPVYNALNEFHRIKFHEIHEPVGESVEDIDIIQSLIHGYKHRHNNKIIGCRMLTRYIKSFSDEMLFIRWYLNKERMTNEFSEWSKNANEQNFHVIWKYFFHKFSPDESWIV